jgi:L-threonylcarbamoyladenylate synthase
MTDWLSQAAERIARGGVVAAATESMFGLLADATNPSSIDRVLSLKARPDEKGILVLLPARASWADLVTEIPPPAARLADAFWPGPLTIALPAKPGLHPRLTVDGTIAVRLAGSSAAAEIARRLGRPITATSANPPGQPASADPAEVRAYFAAAIAADQLAVVDRRAPGGSVSTLVVVRGPAASIVRVGAIAASEIERVLGG